MTTSHFILLLIGTLFIIGGYKLVFGKPYEVLKEITITIFPEDTGKHNFNDANNCPIASGFKHSQFSKKLLGITFFTCTDRKGKKYFGKISGEQHVLAMNLSREGLKLSDEPVKMTFPVELCDKEHWGSKL